MADKQLQCGHTAKVPDGKGAIWCALCGDVALVVTPPAPVNAGTRAALAMVR